VKRDSVEEEIFVYFKFQTDTDAEWITYI